MIPFKATMPFKMAAIDDPRDGPGHDPHATA